MSQLGFLRDVGLPLQLEIGLRRDKLLQAWGARSPENFRRAQEIIFTIENNLKRNKVYHSSLFEAVITGRKQTEESSLKQLLAGDPAKAREYGDPWGDLDKAMSVERQIYLPYTLIENRNAFLGSLAGYARTLVRVATEKPKPNGQRLREYGDANLPSLEQTLFADAPVYPDLEEVQLADSLAMLQEKLPNDAVTRAVLNGRTPAVVAHEAVAGSRLADPGVRRQLYQGGEPAIKASTDTMIVLMRTIDPDARAYRTRYDDEVASVERIAGGAIGRLRFARDGYSVPPDATFTLRLAYGAVRGYVEDGQGDVVTKGTNVRPLTTIGGAFERAEAKGQKDPFRLPKTWLDARRSGTLNLNTPLNFASTNDIIGGNSGSPVVSARGEVVGIIFDGNMQSLPWRYVYDDAIGRAVSVDSRGILEALRHIYNAGRLADELTK
jgi:hypothetical protein